MRLFPLVLTSLLVALIHATSVRSSDDHDHGYKQKLEKNKGPRVPELLKESKQKGNPGSIKGLKKLKPQKEKHSQVPELYLKNKNKGGKQRGFPGKRKMPAGTFMNPALQKVWNMAKVAGFDSHELIALKQDLDYHQKKIRTHRELHLKLYSKDKKHPDIAKMKEISKGFKDEQEIFIQRVEVEASENGREAHVTRAAAINPRKPEKRPSKRRKNVRKHKDMVARKGKLSNEVKLVDLRIKKLRDILDKSELPKEDLEEYQLALLEFEMDSRRIALERRALKELHASTKDALKGKGRGKPFPEGYKKFSHKNEKFVKGLADLEKDIHDRHTGL